MDSETVEQKRVKRLGTYYSIATSIWGKDIGNTQLHLFVWAKFGDKSLKNIPLDSMKDKELVNWLKDKSIEMQEKNVTRLAKAKGYL